MCCLCRNEGFESVDLSLVTNDVRAARRPFVHLAKTAGHQNPWSATHLQRHSIGECIHNMKAAVPDTFKRVFATGGTHDGLL